jgi:hypothetical protein
MSTKFRSPPGSEPIRVALLTGHTTIVGNDWQDLDPRFHREALRLGAQTETAENIERGLDAPVDKGEADAIREAIKVMLDRNSEDDFTASGYPDLRVLRGLAGFNASKDAVYAVFDAMKAEAQL